MSVSRNATYNLVGAVLPLLLALITVPIYLNLVGAERYGVLAIAWLLLGYFGLFDLGLAKATTYGISALKDDAPQSRADVFWVAIAVNAVMGIVGGLVLWALSDLFFNQLFKVDAALRPEIMEALPLLGAAVPIATISGVLAGSIQARSRFLEANIISVVSTALFQIIPIIVAVIWGPELPKLLAAAVVARVAAMAIFWWRCHQLMLRGQRVRLVWSRIRGLLQYGGWITITGIFGPILVILDRFAIGAVLGAKAVTIYTLPFQLAQRIQIFPVSLVSAVFPRLPSASPEERAALSEKMIGVLLAGLSVPILGGIYALHPFLDLWIGPELGRPAADVGSLIMVGFWANAFGIVPFNQMQGSGRPDLVTKILLAQIPFYLLLLYLGMQWFGLIGTAAVFAIRCCVDTTIMWLVALRRWWPLPLIALSGLPLLAGAILSSVLDYTQPAWWLSGIALVGVSALLSWRIAPPELIEMVQKLFRRRIFSRD